MREEKLTPHMVFKVRVKDPARGGLLFDINRAITGVERNQLYITEIDDSKPRPERHNLMFRDPSLVEWYGSRTVFSALHPIDRKDLGLKDPEDDDPVPWFWILVYVEMEFVETIPNEDT